MKNILFLILFLPILGNAQFDDASNFKEGYAVVKTTGFWGVINTKGQMVVKPKYLYLNDFENGLAIAQGENFKGCINYQGDTVIDFIYDKIRAFNEGYSIVRQKLNRLIINKQGQEIFNIRNSEISDVNEGLFQITNSTNQKKYILNINHDTLFTHTYKYFGGFKNGFAKVYSSDEKKWGLINKKGEIVIPFIYNRISQVATNRVIVVSKNLEGVVDNFNNIIIKIEYSSIRYYENFFSLYSNQRGVSISNIEGETVIPFGKIKVERIQGKSDLYLITDKEKSYFIDENINRISPGKRIQRMVAKSRNENNRNSIGYLYTNDIINKYGVLNKSGKAVTSAIFKEVYPNINENFCKVLLTFKHNGQRKSKYFFVNHSNGNFIKTNHCFIKTIDGSNEDAGIDNYISVASQVKLGSSLYNFKFFNFEAEYIFEFTAQEISEFSEGLAAFRINDKWGFIDTLGKIIIEPIYYDGFDCYFKEGIVVITSIKNEEIGYVALNKSGKELFWFEEDSIAIESSDYHFNNGLIAGYSDGLIFLNKKGKVELKTNLLIDEFTSNYGFFKSSDRGLSENYHFGKIGFSSDRLIYFSNSYYNRKFGFINKQGVLIVDTIFDFASPFVEGRALVEIDKKFGFIDSIGEVKIPIIYDWAHSYYNDIAIVGKKDSIFMFDSRGECIFSFNKKSNLSSIELNEKYKLTNNYPIIFNNKIYKPDINNNKFDIINLKNISENIVQISQNKIITNQSDQYILYNFNGNPLKKRFDYYHLIKTTI